MPRRNPQERSQGCDMIELLERAIGLYITCMALVFAYLTVMILMWRIIFVLQALTNV